MHQSLTWSSKKTLRRCFKSWGRRIFTSCSSACFRQILRSLPAMPDMSPSSNGCYVICAFVVTVPWAAVAWAVVCPPLSLTSDYLMAISNVIAFSIVITMAAILNASGVTDIQASGQADEALRALAGPFTFIIFAAGIIGTGLLTVPVLAGSAAYALGESRLSAAELGRALLQQDQARSGDRNPIRQRPQKLSRRRQTHRRATVVVSLRPSLKQMLRAIASHGPVSRDALPLHTLPDIRLIDFPQFVEKFHRSIGRIDHRVAEQSLQGNLL